uniref:IFT81 calponin homology domain-containing protein n=2 Tax=Spongospora subterranea TaxID=70186 RepID=A0A0H5R7Z6_9EUKA|eukprot:CRZ09847.1 hypothetical protein [Spongospora subterranea]
MDEFRLIVNELNKPPFSKALTLVTFDEKNAADLLQLVVDVLGEMDTNQNRDVKHTPKEAIVYAIVDFVTVLNYKPAIEDKQQFQTQLNNDDRRTIHSLLYWLLRPQSMPEFKTRAYLARFLRRLDIPQQFITNDPTDPLQKLNNELRALQEAFVGIHRKVSKIRAAEEGVEPSTAIPPTKAALTKAIEQMESEKLQLESSITRIQSKINSEAQFQNLDFKGILDATTRLRRLQEQQLQLQQSFADQTQLLKEAQTRYDVVHRKWRDVHEREASGNQSTPAQIIQRLRDDVMAMKSRKSKLDYEIEEQQKKIGEFRKTMSSDRITEEQVKTKENELIQIRQDIQRLTLVKEGIYKKTDDQLRIFRNQAGAVENKRKANIAQVAEMESELAELNREMHELDGQLGIQGGRPRTQADIKRYMGELQAKTGTYKALKHELQESRSELAVVMRTEEILRSRDDNLADLIQTMEQEKGITGYEQTQGRIEQVSVAKSGIDVDKGATLEVVSQIINQTLNEIKSKKHDLAPMIQELKLRRSTYEEVEGQYMEKKRIWDSVAIGFDTERSKLEYDLDENSNGFSREESQFHLLNNLLLIEEGKIARLQHEKKLLKEGSQDALMGKYSSYKNMLENMNRDKETESRALRKAQKESQADHGTNVAQRQSFLVFKQLLQMKLQTWQKNPEEQGEHNFLKI